MTIVKRKMKRWDGKTEIDEAISLAKRIEAFDQQIEKILFYKKNVLKCLKQSVDNICDESDLFEKLFIDIEKQTPESELIRKYYRLAGELSERTKANSDKRTERLWGLFRG